MSDQTVPEVGAQPTRRTRPRPGPAARRRPLRGGEVTLSTPGRGSEREVSIRALRNAGKVFSELAEAGKTGRVTSGGRLVGWLVPASPEEQRREELIERGKLRPGRPGGLAGRKPLPRRTDARPLSETLQAMRDEQDR